MTTYINLFHQILQGLVGSIIDSIMGFLVSLIHLVLGCSLGILSGLVGCILGRISYRSDKGEQGEPVGPEFLLRTNEFISSLLDQLTSIFLWISRTNWACTETLLRTLENSILGGWLDDHIIILHHEISMELLPATKHLLRLLYTIIVEILHCLLRILGIELERLVLHLLLGSKITVVETVANLLQTWEQLAVTWINHVAHHIANPVSILVAEGHGICARRIVALRTNGRTAVDRCEGHHVGIIIAKPEHTTDLAWQP